MQLCIHIFIHGIVPLKKKEKCTRFSDRLPRGATVWQQAATESAVIQAAVVEMPGQAERGGGGVGSAHRIVVLPDS